MNRLLIPIIVFCGLFSCQNKDGNQEADIMEKEATGIEVSLNLEKLSDSFKENPKRIFSLTQPAYENADIRMIWTLNNTLNKKQLFFKSNGREYLLDEIFNRVINTDINGAGIQAFDEVTVFSNENYTIIISSTPESASLVYWSSEIKVFTKNSTTPILEKTFYAEDMP